jgi:hypothetical protein
MEYIALKNGIFAVIQGRLLDFATYKKRRGESQLSINFPNALSGKCPDRSTRMEGTDDDPVTSRATEFAGFYKTGIVGIGLAPSASAHFYLC